jgi:hypothetical protein
MRVTLENSHVNFLFADLRCTMQIKINLKLFMLHSHSGTGPRENEEQQL